MENEARPDGLDNRRRTALFPDGMISQIGMIRRADVGDRATTRHRRDGIGQQFAFHNQHARRTGSAALELAYLSIGRLDGFCQLGLKPWDLCAGAVLINEAGGRLTDFDGGDGAIDGGDVIASNGRLHEAILADTKRFFPLRPV